MDENVCPDERRKSVRRMNLDRSDWLWATWRTRTVLPRPTPRTFDLDVALAQVERFPKETAKWSGKWLADGVTPFHWTAEEAEFWFYAINTIEDMSLVSDKSPGRLKRRLSDFAAAARLEKFSGKNDKTWFDRIGIKSMSTSQFFDNRPVSLPLFARFGIKELIPFINATLKSELQLGIRLICDFRTMVLPFLSESEVSELRDWLRQFLEPSRAKELGHLDAESLIRQAGGFQVPQVKLDRSRRAEYLLAAVLGMQEQMRELLENVSAEVTADNHGAHLYAPLILGLGSVEEVLSQWFRLYPRQSQAAYVAMSSDAIGRGFIATTEDSAVDVLAAHVLAHQTWKKEAERSFKILSLVESSVTASHMLHLFAKSRVRKLAKTWMERFPDWTIGALRDSLANGVHVEECKELWADFQSYTDQLQLSEELRMEIESSIANASSSAS